MKIKKQLYIVYIIAAFIPVFVIGISLIYTTRNIITKQHVSQVEYDNTRVRSIMLDVTTSISNLSDNLFNDEILKNIISKDYKSDKDYYDAIRNYSKITTYLKNYTEIFDINIYVDNDSITNYGNIKKVTKEVRENEWYKRAMKSSSYIWMTVEKKDRAKNSLYLLRHVRKIPLVKANKVAILTIDISKNYLKSRIGNNLMLTDISVNDNPIFYSSSKENIGKSLGIDIDYSKDYFKMYGKKRYNNQDGLLKITTQVPVWSSDKLYIATVDTGVISDLSNITLICSIIIIICAIVPFTMIAVYTRTFSERILTLRRDMHKVSNGDYNITEQINGKDELFEVYQDLTTMIESIKKMDMEIYNERISKQKLINHQQRMEFEMLSNQINPHFLYNTLETIRMKAFNVGAREVANAIKLLGKSMRYVLESSKKPATLFSELEYIQIYLSIIMLRFEEKFNYEIDVDKTIDTENYRILPLLLQPIIENSILHGLADIESGGRINILIKKESTELIIDIEDNGTGIPSDELSRILVDVNSSKISNKSSIGLYNINQRIKLFYGRDYGIKIQSNDGEGTKVSLNLPLDFDWRLDNDESIHSG
ncbi:sensor histidine kinase [Anaeromicropila herbilytica]|nr:histidine kinase [Anaeromicropila herbilytica]